jgi:hypothetical protein
MRHEDLQKSSVKHYSLEVGLLDHYDPFEAYRDDVGERIFQTRVPWGSGQIIATALPAFRFIYDIDVIYTNENDQNITVAKLWFGISSENNHLQETLYTPSYLGDKIESSSTFVLPAGSSVLGIELVKNVVYDIDYDNRFRGIPPSVHKSAELAEHELRGAYSGYRDYLNVLVRYRTRDGDVRMVTLKSPDRGAFTMPTRSYDHWEKQEVDFEVGTNNHTILRVSPRKNDHDKD